MNKKIPYCLLITGNANSGKSTVSYELVQNRLRNCLVIDGDRHRQMQFLGEKLGFSEEDILKNNDHVIKLAQFAQEQKFNVVIAQIAPYKSQRDNMRNQLKNFVEIKIKCSTEARSKRPNFTESNLVYEEGNPEVVIDTENTTCVECADKITEYMKHERMI